MAARGRPSAASEIVSLAVSMSGILDEATLRLRLVAVLPTLTGLKWLCLGCRAGSPHPVDTPLLVVGPAPADAWNHVTRLDAAGSDAGHADPVLRWHLPELPGGYLVAAQAPPGLAAEVADALPRLLGSAWVAARTADRRDACMTTLQQVIADRTRSLAIAEARLSDLRSFQEEIVAALGHDLRNPIAVLMGHCQLLQEGLVPPGQEARTHDTLRRQAERLGTMIDELLDRRRQPRVAPSGAAPDDAAALVQEVLRGVGGLAARRRITVQVSADTPAMIDASTALVAREALWSLVEDTLRRTAPDAQLRVHVTSRGAEHHIDLAPTHLEPTPRTGGDPTSGIRAVRRLLQSTGGRLEARGPTGDFPLRVCLPATTPGARSTVQLVGVDPSRRTHLAERLRVRWTVLDCTANAPTPDVLTVVDLGSDTPIPPEGTWLAVVTPDRPYSQAEAVAAGACAVACWPDEGSALEAAVSRGLRLLTDALDPNTHPRPDPVTGLPASASLALQLPALVAQARAAGEPLPAVIVDVVGLSDFNRLHGRPLGDQLLAWLSDVVRDATEPGHLCARLGGDELGAVLPGASIEDADVLGRRIRAVTDRARPRLGLSRYPVKVSVITLDLTRIGMSPTISAVLDAVRGKGEASHGA